MHLKKIELCGFKSFAEKTEIIFEKGVTCIVGPNGCGKSNVSDSIRWVLGERSAKMLRGSKMEDVIFHGTDNHDPVNFAEVTLTIDNSDHALPIQFDEVSITRRLFRSGESEYLLNKTLCRLKDIQDLILDTGIGSNSYSMIEQGRIDYILTAEAEERRFLIEEAAGISKFKVKKDEAIRKLEHTEQNLLRLNDIVAEVERNIKYAERQARRAEQYKVFIDRLKSLELAKLSKEVQESNDVISRLSQQQQELNNRLSENQDVLSGLESQQAESEQIFETLERDYFNAEHTRIQCEQDLTSTQRERETTRERFHETKTSLERTIEEMAIAEETLTRLVYEINGKETELEKLVRLGGEYGKEVAQTEHYLASSHESVNEKSLLIFQYREQSFELASQLTHLRNELNKLHASQHYWKERKKQIAAAIDKTANQGTVREQEERVLSQEMNGLRTTLSERQQALDLLVQNKETIFSELRNVQEELVNHKEKRSEQTHRLDLLKKLDGAAYASVKESLEKRRGDQNPYAEEVQSLLDLLDIEEGYEIATASVLSEFAKAVVTPNAKSALQLLQCVQEDGHHQVSILIRDHVQPAKSATAFLAETPAQSILEKRLLDAIKVKVGYEGLFERLLGDVFVVNEITEENATACASLANEIRLVSKQGTCLGSGFQLSFRNGSPHPLRDLRMRETERLELSQSLASIHDTTIEREQTKIRLEEDLVQLESSLKNTGEELVQLQLHLERVESKLRTLADQHNREREEFEINSNELKEIEINEIKFQESEQELTRQIQEAEARESQIKQTLEEASQSIEECKREKEDRLIVLTRLKTQLESHDRTLEKDREALAMIKSNEADWKKRHETLKQDEALLRERLTHLETQSQELLLREQEFQKNLITASAVTEQKKLKRNECLSAKSVIEAERQKSQKTVLELQQELHQLEKQALELAYHKQSAVERVQNTYHVSFQENDILSAGTDGVDWERLDQTIDELKKKVEGHGAVNLLAIEEYEELKQRFDFLNTQRKDLQESKESLMEAIRKINRTTKELFEETFTRVREMFQAYFRILFHGGEADLVLLDNANPLDSGIEIVARPPGKKLQHITLLSGGEKAMTAIALLFALFKVKPSPFCVLDEIDAPLDESNNERFVKVVQEFLATSQFIIITHSRKTIAIGNSLYGVTMERAGISKLVSVKIGNGTSEIEHSDEKVQKELNAVLQ